MSSFTGQRQGEDVVGIYRRHGYTLIKKLVVPIIEVIIAIAIGMLVYSLTKNSLAGTILWLMITVEAVVRVLTQWIKWYYSFYLVTDQRIRWQSQRDIFRKDVVDVELSRVNNVRYQIIGIAGSLLGFGTITVQTEAGDLVMSDVANCEEVYEKLTEVARLADKAEEDSEEE